MTRDETLATGLLSRTAHYSVGWFGAGIVRRACHHLDEHALPRILTAGGRKIWFDKCRSNFFLLIFTRVCLSNLPPSGQDAQKCVFVQMMACPGIVRRACPHLHKHALPRILTAGGNRFSQSRIILSLCELCTWANNSVGGPLPKHLSIVHNTRPSLVL